MWHVGEFRGCFSFHITSMLAELICLLCTYKEQVMDFPHMATYQNCSILITNQVWVLYKHCERIQTLNLQRNTHRLHSETGAFKQMRWAVHTQACESGPIKAGWLYERAGLKETGTKTERSGRRLKNMLNITEFKLFLLSQRS